MLRLPSSDQIQLDAALGWLGLGNWKEANQELEAITPMFRAHPEVLRTRWSVCAQAGQWTLALEIAQTLMLEIPHDSFGFIHSALSLDRLNRPQEAFDLLQSVVAKFPDEITIRYDAACYACKIGKLKDAMGYLERSIDLAGKSDIRLRALNDPALEPLWLAIGEI